MGMFYIKTWGCCVSKHGDVLHQNMGMFSQLTNLDNLVFYYLQLYLPHLLPLCLNVNLILKSLDLCLQKVNKKANRLT